MKAHQKSMTLPLPSVISSPDDSSSSSSFKTHTLDRSPCMKDFQTPKSEFSTPSDVNRVGQSVFYGNAMANAGDGKHEETSKLENKSDSEEEGKFVLLSLSCFLFFFKNFIDKRYFIWVFVIWHFILNNFCIKHF